MAVYKFGKTSFSNYIWVKGGATFSHVKEVNLEKHDRKRVRVELYEGSTLLGGSTAGAYVNWVPVNVSLIPQRKPVKIKLINLDSGTATLGNGEVYYG